MGNYDYKLLYSALEGSYSTKLISLVTSSLFPTCCQQGADPRHKTQKGTSMEPYGYTPVMR